MSQKLRYRPHIAGLRAVADLVAKLPHNFSVNLYGRRFDAALIGLATLLVVAALVLYNYQLLFGQWNILLALAVPFAAAPILSVVSRNDQSFGRLRAFEIAAFLATCASMVTLQNWHQVQGMLFTHPISTTACIALVWLVTSMSLNGLEARRLPTRAIAWSSVVAAILFYLFARRTDSLFVEWSAAHWAYFVGPIVSVRNGGVLLWDTPAQYGYLTTLIPSALPIRNAWHAFYYFQVGMLFSAAWIFYRTLTDRLGLSKLFGCALVIGTFFLSYPPLIGPAPYPSSSAVRFFWSFALLALAAHIFLSEHPSLKRWLLLGGIMWVTAIFWSAESGVYATVTFWSPVCLHVLLAAISKGTQKRVPIVWFLVPVGLLLAACAVWDTGSRLITGVWLDPSMLFLYSAGYSAGFGSLPIPSFGAIWFYAVLLTLGATALRASLGHRVTASGPAGAIIAAMGCTLAISTYYIGRAVPNNVLAEFSILVFGVLIILKALTFHGPIGPTFRAAALPIFIVAIMSPFWNKQFPPVAAALIKRQHDVLSRLPSADGELMDALHAANITPEQPVAYYGYQCFTPTIRIPGQQPKTFERTWLPGPMQLLEEPVDPLKREEIIKRYHAHNPSSGYLIRSLGKEDDRFAEWLSLLSRFYALNGQWRSGHYQIYHFVPL
jgi:hypothetical protein